MSDKMFDPQRVKNLVESEVCPIHGKHPVVTYVSETGLEFTSCCHEFRSVLESKIGPLVQKEISSSLVQSLWDIFRE